MRTLGAVMLMGIHLCFDGALNDSVVGRHDIVALGFRGSRGSHVHVMHFPVLPVVFC